MSGREKQPLILTQGSLCHRTSHIFCHPPPNSSSLKPLALITLSQFLPNLIFPIPDCQCFASQSSAHLNSGHSPHCHFKHNSISFSPQCLLKTSCFPLSTSNYFPILLEQNQNRMEWNRIELNSSSGRDLKLLSSPTA